MLPLLINQHLAVPLEQFDAALRTRPGESTLSAICASAIRADLKIRVHLRIPARPWLAMKSDQHLL